VRLIPAAAVKPFVRRTKTDARDAAAICAALKHPDMRCVALKSAAQQAARGLGRSRELLVKPHTQLGDRGRSPLAEHGLAAAQGRRGFAQLAALLAAGSSARRAPSPPGRGGRRGSTPPPANRAARASAGRATVACARCSRSAPGRF
jgi:transposase